jgi:hypothetical protein
MAGVLISPLWYQNGQPSDSSGEKWVIILACEPSAGRVVCGVATFFRFQASARPLQYGLSLGLICPKTGFASIA